MFINIYSMRFTITCLRTRLISIFFVVCISQWCCVRLFGFCNNRFHLMQRKVTPTLDVSLHLTLDSNLPPLTHIDGCRP